MKRIIYAMAMMAIVMTSCTQKNMETNKSEVVLENILTRTSVRSYTQEPVAQEQVMLLLKAAMAAPTAVNKQPWHFIVVNDKTVLEALGGTNPRGSLVKDAPLAIVVCGDMDKALEGEARPYWMQDVSAATENLLLAAHGLGLGAVWTGLYPRMERVNAVKAVLNIPESIVPLATVVIGHPAEAPQPKDKFKEENISWNTFGGKK